MPEEMRFTDRALLSGVKETQEGYVIAEAFAVRTGIQLYTGDEVGRPDMPLVRVYRPEEEVRKPESLRTFSHAPVTVGHPSEGVTKDNWRELAVGEVSTEAEWRGNKIRLPLILKDAAAIKTVTDGKARELSAGYTCKLEFTDGVTSDGQQYDAIQRDIRINHLAIVPQGRAGSECRIGDNAANWGPAPLTKDGDNDMPDNIPTVAVSLGDNRAISVPQSIAPEIQQFAKDKAAEIQALKDAHDKALKDLNDKLAKAEADRDEAKKQILTGDALDKLVADRATLIATAKLIAPNVETKGLGDAAIRKAVVLAKRPEAKDKEQPYLDAVFDLLADAAKKAAQAGGSQDPIVQAMGDAQRPQQRQGGTLLSLSPAAGGSTVAQARERALKARQNQMAHLNGAYLGDTGKGLKPQEKME